MLPSCIQPVRVYTRPSSLITDLWNEVITMCNSGNTADYHTEQITTTNTDVFFNYTGIEHIKLTLCLEPDGFCFAEENDSLPSGVSISDRNSNLDMVALCLHLCNNATLEAEYCEIMCITKPHEILADLTSIEDAPFWTDPDEDMKVMIMKLEGRACFSKCIQHFWYTTYCNYMCFGSFNGFAYTTKTTTTTTTITTTTKTTTTTTTTTTSTTTTVTTTTGATVGVNAQQCGYSAALNTLHISEKDDATDYTVEINISTDNDQNAANSTADIYVDLNVTAIVVNGQDVTVEGKYPWLVALRTVGGHHYCGGAILNELWILTAAHCEFSLFGDRVVIGAHYRTNTGSEIIAKVVESIKHPRGLITGR